MSLDLNTCDKTCIDCIKAYKKKHHLVTGQKFEIKCSGIPDYAKQGDLFYDLQETDRLVALTVLDPVKWAADVLDWHCLDPDGSVWKRKDPLEYNQWVLDHPGEPIKSRYHRPYQATMLKCGARRKVFRCGRQIGKCLKEGTMVLTPFGPVPIEKLEPGDTVIGWNKDNTISPCKVVALHNQGIQETIDLTHFDIPLATCTREHRWLTTNQYGDVTKDLKVKKVEDFVTRTTIIRKWYKAPLGLINEPHAYAIGALVGDGCSKEKGKIIYLSSEDELIPSKIARILNTNYKKCSSFNHTWKIQSTNNDCHYYNEWIKNRYAHEKIIDLEVIKTWDRQSCLALLAGLLDSDGSVILSNGILVVSFGMQAKVVIEVIQYLFLALFQYQANLVKDVRDKYKNGPIWSIKCANNLFSKKLLYELDPYLEVTRKKWKNEYFDLLENNSHSDHVGVNVSNKVTLTQCWDITVDNETNLYCLANGLVTHNTETIVVSMLFHLFTKPKMSQDEGFTIIVVTPYQTQIDLIFGRMMQLIRGSTALSNSIRRHVKAPIYTIEFHNNSIVKGFTAGSRAGGNAESVRGQHGHFLVLDEADYLASSDMDAVLSIITNHPNASVWMSSTPIGKRERFYQTCQSKLYKEFHFPSSANPMWSENLEKLFRDSLTEIGYQHEIEAVFGEQEQGVFQNAYVQAAKADYKYNDLVYDRHWIYTFGVDWNDTANGTNITVLGFNPSTGLFRVINRSVVSRDGWTQLQACQRIADLNRIWHPLAIYVDAGYGPTQTEVLRKYGFDAMMDPQKGPSHPDSRLRDIVKKYEFGSSIEVHDLFTKQPIKKAAKPFLVESTIRRFESHDIRFSKYDEILERQLLGYIVKKITANGQPVYGLTDAAIGDHALDSLMLSVVAFVLESTPLGKPKYETNMNFSGYFGEGKQLIQKGDVIITSERDSEKETQRDKARPDLDRMSELNTKTVLPGKNLPAAHIQTQQGQLSFLGFDSSIDKHRNQKHTPRKQENLFLRKTQRPSRNNI